MREALAAVVRGMASGAASLSESTSVGSWLGWGSGLVEVEGWWRHVAWGVVVGVVVVLVVVMLGAICVGSVEVGWKTSVDVLVGRDRMAMVSRRGGLGSDSESDDESEDMRIGSERVECGVEAGRLVGGFLAGLWMRAGVRDFGAMVVDVVGFQG